MVVGCMECVGKDENGMCGCVWQGVWGVRVCVGGCMWVRVCVE